MNEELKEAKVTIASLTREREALRHLCLSEALYRKCHDLYGGGDIKTGAAWDAMRRDGDKARKLLEGKP